MLLDVHPAVRHLLGIPIPLFVTEGIKKGDSLASRELCAIALLGVWNWRGTNADGGKVALARLGVGRPERPPYLHRVRLRRDAEAAVHNALAD